MQPGWSIRIAHDIREFLTSSKVHFRVDRDVTFGVQLEGKKITLLSGNRYFQGWVVTFGILRCYLYTTFLSRAVFLFFFEKRFYLQNEHLHYLQYKYYTYIYTYTALATYTTYSTYKIYTCTTYSTYITIQSH